MSTVLEPPVEKNGNGHGEGERDPLAQLDELHYDGTGGPKLRPEAPPSTKATKGKTSRWYYVILFLVFVVFLVICYFVLFGGSKKTDVPVGSGQTATGARKAEDAATTADKAIGELKQVVAQPTPVVLAQQPGQPDALAQPVSPPNSLYSPNPYAMNQPVSPPGETTPQPTPAATETPRPAITGATAAPAAGGGDDKERARESAPPAPSASKQTSYYVFNRDGDTSAFAPARSAAPYSVGEGEADSPPTKPPFNTVINVRLLGRLYSFRNGALARFITTQPASGPGWSLPRGTLFVGSVEGVQNDRLYVKIEGFVDRANRLVKVGGAVLDRDETEGLGGKRQHVGSAWKKFLAQLANAGVQLGTARIGQSGPVVIASQQQSREIFSTTAASSSANADYVVVQAGVLAKIFVSDKPPSVEGVQPTGADEQAVGYLTDEELARLLSTGTPEQIRAAMPRMRPELRQVAEELLAGAQP
jgi:hypothetical protein